MLDFDKFIVFDVTKKQKAFSDNCLFLHWLCVICIEGIEIQYYLDQPLYIICQTLNNSQLHMKIFVNFIEEQFKDDKYQLHFYYNKYLTIEEEAEILINHPQILLLCDRCERKLNKATSVLLFSGEERKELCISCFLKMDQSQKYYYMLRQNMDASITQEGWNMTAELLLLNALQIYGFGNWGQVKNYLDYHSSNFSEKEIEDHYHNFYLTSNLEPVFCSNLMEMLKQNTFDQTRSQQIPVYTQENLVEDQHIQAYNQKRQEHIYDYDPMAEQMICDLEFSANDAPDEIQLKYLIIAQYNERIKQRRKREQYVIEHKLLSEEYGRILLSSGIEKASIRQRMSCFSRFQSHEEAERLVSYLTMQSTLKATINELAKQRRHCEDASFQSAFSALEYKRCRRSFSMKTAPTQLKAYRFEEEGSNKRPLEEQAKRQTQSLQSIKKRLKSVQFLKQGYKIVSFSLRRY